MTTTPREPDRFLVFSASLRAGSLNTRLARLVVRLIEDHGGAVYSAAMADFDCPSYSQDAQSKNGIAPGAVELERRLEANDAFVIASPEYNSSMPGLLKNAIDWASLAPVGDAHRHRAKSIMECASRRIGIIIAEYVCRNVCRSMPADAYQYGHFARVSTDKTTAPHGGR